MIIMIMTHQYNINFRKFIYFTRCLSKSFRSNKLKRRASFRKYRIDNKIRFSTDSNHSSRMTDPCVSDFVLKTLVMFSTTLIGYLELKNLILCFPFVQSVKFGKEILSDQRIINFIKHEIKPRGK